MEATDQIKIFNEFFDKVYKAELLESVRKGNDFFVVDFQELVKFSPELSEFVLEQPDETIKAAEIAVEQIDLPRDIKRFRIRFRNLPESQKIMIRNIRSIHIGKLFTLDGVVRQKSDVRPQVTSAKFECPSCGNIITVLQLDKKFKEPSRCGCGRKGKFRLISKELIDAQGIVLEEAPEDLEGGEQPKRMNVLLTCDLVSPITEKQTNPGSKVCVIGQIKEVPIIGRDGGKLTRFDLMIEGNFIEGVQEDFFEVSISDEEKEQIEELSKDPNLFKKLISSAAPSIYGYERIKEAILLQLAGGVRKVRSDTTVSRGDIHILLIGDPGAAKSQLLKRTSKIAPKARYVSGKGASGAGLTAAVVKDEFLAGWSLEAGALVLAHRGLCAIDELDKMSREDTSAMHEALEGQTVTISKANIQATLVCETTVLAAANPKFGRFDPYEILAKQIDLPPALINRFDLIFPVKDLPNAERDEKLAKHVLALHTVPDFEEPEIGTRLLRKYIAYAKQTCFPKMTDVANEEIRRYYVEMRNSGGQEEAGIRAVPISARQLEALVRLAEASARLRLSDKVQKRDAKKAIELIHYCLSQVGLDPETGKIDIDRIATGIPASQRSSIVVVREIIHDLESKIGKTIPIEDILSQASEKGVSEAEVEEAIEKLKRSGDIFEPRRGFVCRI